MKYVSNGLAAALIISVLFAIPEAASALDADVPRIPYAATAKALGGKTVSLADYKGKLVFLTVWRTDCKACMSEIPILNKIQEEYADDDFTVIGLSMDRGKENIVNKVLEMRDIRYPIWLGYGEPLSKYTFANVLPTLFIVGPEGEMMAYMQGAFRSYEHAVAAIAESRKLVKEMKASE